MGSEVHLVVVMRLQGQMTHMSEITKGACITNSKGLLIQIQVDLYFRESRAQRPTSVEIGQIGEMSPKVILG